MSPADAGASVTDVLTRALAGPAHGPRPVPIRRYLRPAPPLHPPYDDERPDRGEAPCRGSQELPFDSPREPEPIDPVLPVPFRPGGLPDPEPFALAFVRAAVEIASGHRAATTLQRSATPALLGGLARAGARARARGPQPPARVRSVRVCEPAPGVAEVSAVISRTEDGRVRFRAVAARLEDHHGRWRCVTLQIG